MELTKSFASKSGDKILVEIRVVGDPDLVVKSILQSVLHGDQLFDGAVASQIFLAGFGINDVVENAKIKVIQAVNQAISEIQIEQGF